MPERLHHAFARPRKHSREDISRLAKAAPRLGPHVQIDARLLGRSLEVGPLKPGDTFR